MRTMRLYSPFLCAAILFGMIALTVSSCITNDIVPNEEEELRFDIKVINESSIGTKVVKTDWEVGDKIFVYFYNDKPRYVGSSGEKYVTLTYDGAKWNAKSTGVTISTTTGNSYTGKSGTMYGIYFPFGNAIISNSSYSPYYAFTGSGNSNSALNNYPIFSYYLIDAGSGYTVSGSTLSGTLHMSLPENFVYFYIEAADGKYNENEKYRLSVDGVKPATVIRWNNSNGSIVQAQLSAGLPMWGYKYGNGIAFAGIIDESWNSAADHQFIFFSDGDPAITKTFSSVSLSSHESVRLKTPNSENGWERYMADPEYVEIGGIKWSKWNLGCISENDTEHYSLYRWAELVPNTEESSSSEYPQPPVKNASLIGDYAIFDPVRAALGSNWRMPTNADFNTLIDNCTISHTNDCFTLTSNAESEKHLYFYTHSAYGKSGTNNYLLTSTSYDATYIYLREYHSGENALSSQRSGDSSKRINAKQAFIRPIFIGE